MTKKILKYKGLLLLIGIYLLLLIGIKGELINFYWENIIKLALINIILVVSLNLSTGLLGQLNLAHSAFMAIGAYACVFFTRNLFFPGFINFLFGLFLGGILAMIFAYLISAPAMKIPGNYLIIATIAANEVIKDLIINLNILGGSSGIHGISCYSHFSFVYLTMALVIISIYVIEDSKYVWLNLIYIYVVYFIVILKKLAFIVLIESQVKIKKNMISLDKYALALF